MTSSFTVIEPLEAKDPVEDTVIVVLFAADVAVVAVK